MNGGPSWRFNTGPGTKLLCLSATPKGHLGRRPKGLAKCHDPTATGVVDWRNGDHRRVQRHWGPRPKSSTSSTRESKAEGHRVPHGDYHKCNNLGKTRGALPGPHLCPEPQRSPCSGPHHRFAHRGNAGQKNPGVYPHQRTSRSFRPCHHCLCDGSSSKPARPGSMTVKVTPLMTTGMRQGGSSHGLKQMGGPIFEHADVAP
ncbi:MAG: hypothetical protein CM15mP128_4210 [Methanobacteriota archaeon]|nr:MAG: hypothetical protein CM15mP128_4210 [Euryarchaeota archaeon]